ncbi:hypothetical protein [Nonomuraea longicatena]
MERDLLSIEQTALSRERARLRAAEDLLALVDDELAAMRRAVDQLGRL